jgi:hypothetical protein
MLRHMRASFARSTIGFRGAIVVASQHGDILHLLGGSSSVDLRVIVEPTANVNIDAALARCR